MTQKVTDNMVTLSGTGLVASSGGAVVQRTLTAGTGISITNGDGTSGNPTITSTVTSAPRGVQTFTASGTFTVPAGVSTIKVTCQAGGGNGGNSVYVGLVCCSPQYSWSSGGAGGGVGFVYISVTTGQTFTVTVGGVAQASSFGSAITCTGGAHGSSSSSVSGCGSASGTGVIKLHTSNGAAYAGGAAFSGGSSFFGGGGVGNGGTANGYGAGGACGGVSGGGGGGGTPGIVVVEW